MYNRTLLIRRIGHNAESKTDKNQQEYVVLSIATKDSCKNERREYESRTEWWSARSFVPLDELV